MATEDAQVVELYDFLYKDSNRLNSYYSQIFQGKLASFEELETESDSKEKNLEAKLEVASVNAKTTDSKQASAKRIFDPYDLNTTDVLSYLQTARYIHTDYENAPNGSIVLVKGKLFFNDRHLISAAAQAATIMMSQPNPPEEYTQEHIVGIPVVQQMLTDKFFQPICFLQTEEGHLVTGTVKEEGLEEPVSTYYIKYGGWGLDGVYIIGLKEAPELLDEDELPDGQKGMMEFTYNVSSFLCGQDSIKVTPLAIFRKFEPIKE